MSAFPIMRGTLIGSLCSLIPGTGLPSAMRGGLDRIGEIGILAAHHTQINDRHAAQRLRA